jgi:membrane protease YdiL (CAAX protease family)
MNPYIYSIPLICTATTPTVCRIILTNIISSSSSTGKTTLHPQTDTYTKWIQILFLEYTFTYIFPCLWLLRMNYQQNDTDICQVQSGTEAIYTSILWGPITYMFSQWTCISQYIITKKNDNSNNNKIDSLQLLVDGGPLGKGCRKIIQVIVAYLLWSNVRGTLPRSILNTGTIIKTSILSLRQVMDQFNWIYIVTVVIIIGIVSWIVDITLSLWLYYTQSQCDSHDGLNKMLQPTLGRQLTTTEHFQLIVLAILNATCEEYTCRGFWRSELEYTACCTKFQSNLIQGIIFGIWHYFGIPNGWTGVILTTIYGWIMGYLSDWTVTGDITSNKSDSISTGLLLPIVTHSIADYYIFTVLARQQNRLKDKK